VGADDLTTDKPLGLGGVFDLLGDRDAEAGVEELSEIPVEGMMGYAAHGGVHRIVLPSSGQGDAEHRRRLLGVLEEQLLEVAHAVKEKGRTRLPLEIKVLTEHGSHLQRGFLHRMGTFIP
jgi:hypothetical protein